MGRILKSKIIRPYKIFYIDVYEELKEYERYRGYLRSVSVYHYHTDKHIYSKDYKDINRAKERYLSIKTVADVKKFCRIKIRGKKE